MSDWYRLNPDHTTTKMEFLAGAREFEHADRKVALTEVGPCEVSTVFLGLDHSYGDGPPLLFETLVFGGAWDQDMERYSTWDEAVAGHNAVCEQIREALAAAEAAGYEVPS